MAFSITGHHPQHNSYGEHNLKFRLVVREEITEKTFFNDEDGYLSNYYKELIDYSDQLDRGFGLRVLHIFNSNMF